LRGYGEKFRELILRHVFCLADFLQSFAKFFHIFHLILLIIFKTFCDLIIPDEFAQINVSLREIKSPVRCFSVQ
jgi:hypothetical protein